MELDTTRENIIVNKLINEKEEIVTIEGDIIVPDVKPDILNIVDSNGAVCIYKKEILEGKVKFEGSINLNIMYLADSQNDLTRSLCCNLDFSQMINVEKCKSGMTIKNRIDIKDIECKVLNGRKINIKAVLKIGVSVYSNEEISILKGLDNVENIQILNTNIRINNLVGTGKCKALAKDTISLEDGDILGEILKTEINVINKETKVSYNKVLIKADTNVKIMYLTEQERKIKTINAVIPIMGFIDIDKVSEENSISTNYEIKNIIIKPDTSGQPVIYVEIEFEIECDATDNINIELIQDMYSPIEDIEFTSKDVITESNKKIIKDICSIKNEMNIPEISNGILYDVTVKPNLIKSNILNGKIIYEGEIELNYIFGTNTNNIRLENRKYKLPFTFEIENDDIKSNKIINTVVNCVDNEFIIEADGKLNCKIDLEFEATMYNNVNMSVIDKVNITCKDNIKTPSMVIYIVKQGDTIWNIAKKYKTTMEKIIEANNLENPDCLDIGQKLFIPRYTKKIA